MCGIAGFWNKKRSFDSKVAYLIAESLKHRGPDDTGVWNDQRNGLTLIHTRLSILDLSSAGHQPMQSSCSRYVISYNGEIYNHQDIRKELENYSIDNWKSSTDTETLLTAIKIWGLDKTLQKINGMFAFALWDCKNKTLVLARDRMGEKPLYYGLTGDTFIFGSELKALKFHPDWNAKIDQEALSLYIRFNYVPSPKSIFKNIYKLQPAHYLIIKEENINQRVTPIKYWNLTKYRIDKFNSDENKINELEEKILFRLRDSVSKRMISDVPIGSFLSGGFDSTLVTALMQEQSPKPINTFTVGFSENQFNEAEYAKKISQILGTNHSEIYLDSKSILNAIPKMSQVYDEPFADNSQIPTYLISKFASKKVKVCLSGDGGDELFYGYNRYLNGVDIFNLFNKLPKSVKSLFLKVLYTVPFHFLEFIQKISVNKNKPSNLAIHISKLLSGLEKSDEQSFYLSLISNRKDANKILMNPFEHKYFFKELPEIESFREKMMFMDMHQYLPDDILTKVDRASMANSLEVRAPFLDHNLVELCLKIPENFKYKKKQGKWILKQLVYKYIPKEIMDRPKKGFDTPMHIWLKEDLKDWAMSLLNENKLKEDNLFNSNTISQMWQEHQLGKCNWQNNLWNILMFQDWKKNF
jgi:asparagine synthase (glutamine-hydrolysing)